MVLVFVTVSGWINGHLAQESYAKKIYAQSVGGRLMSAIQITTACGICAMTDLLVEGKLPLISVALVNSWVAVPFATIVYRAALLDIPQEVLEAAAVDGALPRQIVRYVVVPMLRPVMIVLRVAPSITEAST